MRFVFVENFVGLGVILFLLGFVLILYGRVRKHGTGYRVKGNRKDVYVDAGEATDSSCRRIARSGSRVTPTSGSTSSRSA